MNKLGTSCEQDMHELCGTTVNDFIKVCAQQRIPPKSLFTSGDKLETICETPRHLTKHTASAFPSSLTRRQNKLEGLILTRVTRSLKKSNPIFGNVAKTVAKLQRLKLKVKNSCIKLLLNVKISTTNCVLKLLILVKF